MANVRMTMDEVRALARVNRTKVDATTEEDVRRHMIEDGEDPDAPLGPGRVVWPPAAIRAKTGLTQAEFAGRLGIPLKTWRNWEQGRTGTEPAVRALLALIADDPERAFKVLAE